MKTIICAMLLSSFMLGLGINRPRIVSKDRAIAHIASERERYLQLCFKYMYEVQDDEDFFCNHFQAYDILMHDLKAYYFEVKPR